MIKRYIALLLAFSACIALFGCSGKDGDSAAGSSKDYSSETVIGNIESAAVISAMTSAITALTVDSIDLPEFSSPSEIIASCRDAVLSYMLSSDYSRFSSNTKLLEQIKKDYPDRTVTAAIGTKDYESTLYKLFGYSDTVRHSETKRFIYLPKSKAYTPAATVKASSVVLDIQSATETENTYQMTFFALIDDETSPPYTAVFAKKDTDIHLKSLTKGKGEKLTADLDTGIS